MKVRATRAGFYKRLYMPGESFNVPSEMFSEKWMEKVATPGRPPKDKPKSKGWTEVGDEPAE